MKPTTAETRPTLTLRERALMCRITERTERLDDEDTRSPELRQFGPN